MVLYTRQEENKMMNLIAWGLEVGHPFVYFLIFMIIGIPIAFIIISVFADWFYNKKDK